MAVDVKTEGGVAQVVLNNPPLNILTREMMAELRQQLETLQSTDTLRALVLRAEGKHFSAGADVSEHLPPDYEAMIPEFIDTIVALDRFPLPIVAAVRGRCLGGGFELVQPVDFIVAGAGASFGQPEIALGVIPPAACALLPRLCSPAVAAEIALTGDAIDSRRAAGIGLVWKVVEDDMVEEEALNLASRMARHSAAALRLAKKALRQTDAANRAQALAAAGELYVNELMKTADAMEGLTAFLEKRTAEWKHR